MAKWKLGAVVAPARRRRQVTQSDPREGLAHVSPDRHQILCVSQLSLTVNRDDCRVSAR